MRLKTLDSRMRRAMSCVYCDPKSRTRIVSLVRCFLIFMVKSADFLVIRSFNSLGFLGLIRANLREICFWIFFAVFLAALCEACRVALRAAFLAALDRLETLAIGIVHLY